jgi:hypothetical protein
MQISLSKFLGVVIGILGVGMFLFFGYFCYILFFTGETISEVPTLETVNITVLGPKMQKAGAILVNKSDKIMLKEKDIIFTKGDLFKSFTEIPEGIPMSDSRGRADPFVPYVAPSYVAP